MDNPADFHRPRGAAAFDIGRLDRIREALPQILAPQLDAVDDHLEQLPVAQRGRVHIVERHGAAVDEQPAEALSLEHIDRRRHRRTLRTLWTLRTLRAWCFVLYLFPHLVGVTGVGHRRRSGHDREVEANQQAGAGSALAELSGDHFGGFAHHLTSAVAAERASDARVQQPHVVVDFRRRADGRAGVADAVLLPDGDGRRDAVDSIDVRLLHPLEKLARVRGQRFDVPALPFRVDRVEGERRLSRSAHAGDDNQRPDRQGQIDILEIVGARAPDDDFG